MISIEHETGQFVLANAISNLNGNPTARTTGNARTYVSSSYGHNRSFTLSPIFVHVAIFATKHQQRTIKNCTQQ